MPFLSKHLHTFKRTITIPLWIHAATYATDAIFPTQGDGHLIFFLFIFYFVLFFFWNFDSRGNCRNPNVVDCVAGSVKRTTSIQIKCYECFCYGSRLFVVLISSIYIRHRAFWIYISEWEELLYTFHFNSYPIQATNSGRQITLSLFLFLSALFDAIFILFILRFFLCFVYSHFENLLVLLKRR